VRLLNNTFPSQPTIVNGVTRKKLTGVQQKVTCITKRFQRAETGKVPAATQPFTQHELHGPTTISLLIASPVRLKIYRINPDHRDWSTITRNLISEATGNWTW